MIADSISVYLCPNCNALSRRMMPAMGLIHEVTSDEEEREPELAWQCGHEILVCPCGRLNTWFSLEKIEIGFMLFNGGEEDAKN